MLGRRVGRGGLLRAAATTAVISGTATAVSGGIRSRQDARAQQGAEAEAYERQQQQAAVTNAARTSAATQQPVVGAPPSNADLMTQLQDLAAMHAQGILSDDEFVAAKAKLLA